MTKDESRCLIEEMHVGDLCGGNFARKATTHKIVHVSLYRPTLIPQVNGKVISCIQC